MTDLHPGRVCPACGREVDDDTNANPADPGGPKPGDISVCLYCAHLNVYTEDLGLRGATQEEAHALLMDRRVRRAIAATAEYRRRFGT